MKKITFLFAAILLSLYANAQSFTAIYAFDSVKITSGIVDLTPVPTAVGATFGSFSATGTPANPNATGRFSFTDWATGATASSDVYTAHTGIINTAEYYQVTISPVTPYTISLTDLTFKIQRSGTGVRTYAVRSSIDGFTTNLSGSINPLNPNLSVQLGDIFYWNFDVTTSGQDGSTVTLGGLNYTNLSSPVTFRFYGWNTEGIGGTFSIDNVTINGSSAAPATLMANFTADSVCNGDSTVFTNTTSGPNPTISNVWNFGDGSPLSTATNPSHLYSAPGNYEVSLTVIDNMADTSSYTDSITVYALPVADFSAPDGCPGIIPFTDLSTSSDGTISSFLWNFGDPASGTNNMATIQNPVHTYATSGTYAVTQIVNSSLGCTNTLVDSVTIFPFPVASFSAPAPICGELAQFYDSSTVLNETISGWMWDFGDAATGASNFSSAQNPMHVFSSQGSFTVTEIVYSSNGCADTTTLMISNYIVTGSLPFIQTGDSVYFSGFATGGSSPYTYLLDLGAGGGPTITTPNYSYVYPDGTYTACLYVWDNNGCSDTTCATFTIMTVGVSTNNNSSSIRIFPNPSRDGLFILNIENSAKANITVYNIIGKNIVIKEVSEGKNTIDLSGEANGSYFVTIQTDKEVITKKIIINK